VSVVTARNYYGTDRLHERARETIEGIEVHRVRGTTFGKGNVFGRLADFATFYAAAAAQLQRIPPADVVVALTSPPMIALLGALQRFFRRTHGDRQPVRFVYYVMDLYPDAAIASGMLRRGSIVERALRSLTSRTLAAADGIIALGRDMKHLIRERYGRRVPDARVHVVPPWADGRELVHIERRLNPMAAEFGMAGKFTVLYSGNFGVAHDVDTVAAALKQTHGEPDLTWLFIGGGRRVHELQRRAQRERWWHVKFLPYQDRDALNFSLNVGDVHLVTQLPAFTGVVVPSKLFGSLAVGRPVLMVGPPDAECSRIVAEHGAGFVIPNGDADQLVRRVRELRSNAALRDRMGRAARAALEAHYDRPIACQTIEDLLVRVVAGP
jgi:glycosyltransferase involved in cell wall biosynthesis